MSSNRNFTETVFICSPYRPASTEPLEKAEELRGNIRLARRACELAVTCGYMPLAPHCYFTGFLNDDDPEQRKDGLKLAKGWLDISDMVWVFGDHISEGMAEEIAYASELGIPIRMMRDPAEGERRLMEAIFGKEAISGSDKKDTTEGGEEAVESEGKE